MTWKVALVAAVSMPMFLVLPKAPASAAGQFEVIATVNVGTNPFGAAMAPDGSSIWVANSGSFSAPGTTVTVIDPQSFAIQSVIPVGNFPEDIAFAANGTQAFVTNSSDATVSVIDTATRQATQTVSLASVPMTFPFGVVASTDSRKVFVTSVAGQRDRSRENVAVLDNSDPSNVTVNGGIPLVGGTGRPAVTPDGTLLVVGHDRGAEATPGVAFIDPRTNAFIGELTLAEPGIVPAVSITPDGRFAYATRFSIDGGTGKVWVIDLATRSTVTVVPMPDRSMHGIRVSPDGRFVFATNFSLGQVSVLSTSTNEIIANIPVGPLPNDIAFSADGTKAFVTNEGDTTVSVIAIAP